MLIRLARLRCLRVRRLARDGAKDMHLPQPDQGQNDKVDARGSGRTIGVQNAPGAQNRFTMSRIQEH
jgi:hypothetical protein